MSWIKPSAVYDGRTCLGRDLVLATDQDNCVVDMVRAQHLPAATPVENLSATAICGLFDTQVNGGGDVMLNNVPTADGVDAIARAHRSLGTEFILPTVITDAPDIMRRAADAVLSRLGKNGVLGIHIEGPHINPARKGTHREAFIRPFDDMTMDVVKLLRSQQCPVLITLAPECLPDDSIAKLDQMGVIVSLGHSAADAKQTRRAEEMGARAVTHLHNGMPSMLNRAPGLAGAALLSDMWCGIIADGHHVAPEMLQITLASRPRNDRMVLVSDAMSTVGGGDSFTLYGEKIRVEGGRLINEQGSLAGAHITLSECVTYMHTHVGVSLADALAMASDAPFEMMKLPRHTGLEGRVVCLVDV